MVSILPADESSTMLTGMGQFISDPGQRATTADSGGTEMSKTSGGGNFDLKIIDFNIRCMNGAELMSAARKIAGFRFAPTLFLTTETRSSKQQQAKQTGTIGWLTKLVQTEQPISALSRVLN